MLILPSIPYFRDLLLFDREDWQTFIIDVMKAGNMLSNDYLNKARTLFISVMAALVVNAGFVALLDSITTSKPQNAAPLFSVDGPREDVISCPISIPRSRDHSKTSVFSSYAVTLHPAYSPFPESPNPGKLKRPLDHDHDASLSPCIFCNAITFRGIGM